MNEQLAPQEIKKAHLPTMIPLWVALVFLALAFLGALYYGRERARVLDARLSLLTYELSSTTNALLIETRAREQALAELNTRTSGISETLMTTKEDVASAHDTINAVDAKVGGVEETIGSISGTVTTLKKLSTIDSELLKKYSKVYFLNENYTPAHLDKIPQEYVYSNTKEEYFLSEAYPFLERLLKQAKADKVEFYVYSGYRSFAKQQTLKTTYTVLYGAGTANSFSADQGYSEHQLGITVDFINPGASGQLSTTFAGTDAFRWLSGNAHRYGFVLSYPEQNSYYIYEPWHWRFVGVELATYLHNNKLKFYDVDQREIDTYLADLFDSPF
jgi:LAS superfamily LD-carboxypeptidase LdcB